MLGELTVYIKDVDLLRFVKEKGTVNVQLTERNKFILLKCY